VGASSRLSQSAQGAPPSDLGHDLALPPSLSRRISGDNVATSLLLATARAKTPIARLGRPADKPKRTFGFRASHQVLREARDMDADEDAAIVAWIRGTEKLPQPNFPSPGLAALIRRLRTNMALGERVSAAIALALEPIGATKHELKLVRCERPRRRGRPRQSARDAVDQLGLGAEANATIATKETAGKKRVRDLETGDFAKAKRVSKAKVYAARSKLAKLAGGKPRRRRRKRAAVDLQRVGKPRK
jgi:hypothetical protein